ncbi:MAG: NAD(P)-dependent oxidoreductase [Odoribacter sp.]
MNIVLIESLGMCECAVSSRTSALKQAGHHVIYYGDRTEDEEVLIERAKDADVVVVSNIPLKKHFFESCPKLKMLSVAFTGLDHIDLEECRKRGIIVCNAAGYSTHAVAELAIGMMIAVYRKIIGGDAVTRTLGDRQGMLGSELYGKTVGIVGAGAIGSRVALLANAFGCKTLFYNRSPKVIHEARQVDKDTLLGQSDIITVHLPLNPETKGWINTAEFAKMQAQTILINTARGPVVDQDALYNALKKGLIAGAAVDVYDREPPLPANLSLFNAPNLVMLPHLGYATKEAFVTRLDIVVGNIERWIKKSEESVNPQTIV